MGFRRNRYKKFPKLQFVLKLLADMIVVCCLGIVLVQNVLEKVNISGNSMSPALVNEDQVFINHFAYTFSNPSRYDVIAFEVSGVKSSRIYVKRVIGLPGEKVRIDGGKVYINGALLADDVSDETIITAGLAATEIQLGEDEYFVLGDNRNNSEDSRFANIGNVKKANIIGRPWLIVFPFGHFGFV